MRITLYILGVLIALTGAARALPALSDQVTVRITAYGVPHILAETEAAAAYGFAWVQAEDHFPLLYQAMVRGRSEMSLRYGATDANIEFDLQTRQLRARRLVYDTYHLLPDDYRSVVEGFAEGLNAYMAAHPEEIEPWMTPVTPHDVLAAWQVAVMRFTFLRGNIIGRFNRAMDEHADQQAALSETFPDTIGSNTIALGPDRTQSGHTMLLNNPHQPWSDQARYYEAHITVPGRYNFYGSTFIGGHMLTTGFNDHLGWAHTVNHPDLEEFYEVTLDPARPDHYLFDGGAIPFEKETIIVSLPGGETRERASWWSPLGPVVRVSGEKAWILRSAGQGQYQTGLQWYRMAQATSLEGFREVLRMQQLPMFNIGYADHDGNIMYLWNGTVPMLPHASHRYTPVAASETAHVWTRVHPLDDLMQHVNPAGGYIQNCNSPPYFTNLHAPLEREAYPAHFPANDLSLRTQQGLSLVHNDRTFTLDDLVAAKYNTHLLLADRVKPDLIRALEQAALSSEERTALDRLRSWDHSTAAASVGSVLFTVWWELYREGGGRFAEPWNEEAPMDTPRGLDVPEIAVASFRSAIAETAKRWGRWDIAWGEVHRMRRGEIDLPIGGAGGELGCFRVLDYADAEDGLRVVSGGDGFVFAVEFGEVPRACSVLAFSQSDRPASPHFNDQAELFVNHQMKPVAFTEDQIADALLREYRPGG